ncbi:MAG: alpha/beta fold hydrolase [Betaproteobacteria bacterium]|nr:MAG: alpha/beta fold hydrolase [Betaproteobacteria bacterium]
MCRLNTAESTLYPALEPFAQQQLPVGGGHAIHFEQCGNPAGFPAIFLHGGPGSHTQPLHRRFFDPQFYRIVLSDQRGCGRSVPLGCTEENTTRHLVEDIEALRDRLGLERVMLFGGSWGGTLALAYAAAHPQRVAAMVLRGVFLGTRAEVDRYLNGLAEGGDVLARYHALVNQPDEAAARAAAQRWVGYEEAVMSLDAGGRDVGAAQNAAGAADPAAALARARVQLHYLVHDCFLEPGELVSSLTRLGETQVLIVQGKRDQVCPPRAALELAERLPRAELRLIERGGHSAAEPAMAQALRGAADDLRRVL